MRKRKRHFTDFDICIGWRVWGYYRPQLSKWVFSFDCQSEDKGFPMQRKVAGLTILGFYVRLDRHILDSNRKESSEDKQTIVTFKQVKRVYDRINKGDQESEDNESSEPNRDKRQWVN